MSNRKFINMLIFFLSRYHISSFCHPPNVISNISNRLCRNSIFKLVKLNILNELQKYASFMISCTASKCNMNIWLYLMPSPLQNYKASFKSIGTDIDSIPLRCRKESLFTKWGMPLGSTMSNREMTETDLWEFEPKIFHSLFFLTSKSCQLIKWPIWAFLMTIAVWCTMEHG